MQKKKKKKKKKNFARVFKFSIGTTFEDDLTGVFGLPSLPERVVDNTAITPTSSSIVHLGFRV